MTVKTISRVQPPLSDLLVAMTVCNTANFDESAQADDGLSGGKKPRKKKQPLDTEETRKDMTKSARRKMRYEEIQGKKAIGAPSEVALIKYAQQLINVHEFRRRYNVCFKGETHS
jgi:hypothetical protein